MPMVSPKQCQTLCNSTFCDLTIDCKIAGMQPDEYSLAWNMRKPLGNAAFPADLMIMWHRDLTNDGNPVFLYSGFPKLVNRM